MRITLMAVLLLALPGLAHAQSYGGSNDRTGTWEWSFAGIYQDSERVGADGGSTAKMDSAFGLGMSFTYNFNNRLALGMDFDWLRPDYSATLIDASDPDNNQTVDHWFTQINTRLKGVYSFMDGPLTPYVEAGIGWTFMDSNVLDGPPITGCWWHPWWGYICDSYYSTYTETPFTYGGALGVRYTLKSGTIVKLSYNNWVMDNMGDGGADPSLSAFRLEFGWRF